MLDNFLVCGLGILGQHCVVALKEFGVKVTAIEKSYPNTWEIPSVPGLLSNFLEGDCRHLEILRQAEIPNCRAALIVTGNEQINIETALAIHQLNPQTRLVVSSGKENLNQLLSQNLNNFIAFEPTDLPSSAFVLAALGSDIIGLFSLDGKLLKVKKEKITPSDYRCQNIYLYDFNTRHRRLIAHFNSQGSSSQFFHQWEPDKLLQAEDTIIYIETEDSINFSPKHLLSHQKKNKIKPRYFFRISDLRNLSKRNIQRNINNFWSLTSKQQLQRIAYFSLIVIILLLLIGAFLFSQYFPETTFVSALYATVILLLGGYGDLFGEFQEIDIIPNWLQLFALIITIAGTIFVGILYAFLTEFLLSSKFQFVKQRPPVPQENHIIIVGLGRVGQRMATLLKELKESVVGVTFNLDFDRPFGRTEGEQKILPQTPIVVGNLKDTFERVNLSTAKSIVVATDDEITNLEIALMTRKSNPDIRLVIRTLGQSLTEKLTHLLPEAQVFSAQALAAEVFAGAAFGENIISLFRLNNQNILVTEYTIEANDTLNGLSLGNVAYGYGVIPILYQKFPNSAILMPLDDLTLSAGDRLVVLATIQGLRAIEQGTINTESKCFYIRLEKALSQEAIFEGANVITRIAGYNLSAARKLMRQLPQTLPLPLYKHQAKRLVRELNKIMVKSHFLDN